MKWKHNLTIILTNTAFGLIFTTAFLMSTLIQGFDKAWKEVDNNFVLKFMITISCIGFFATVILAMRLFGKVELFDNIETKEKELEEEKLKYRKATEAFLEKFKIEK